MELRIGDWELRIMELRIGDWVIFFNFLLFIITLINTIIVSFLIIQGLYYSLDRCRLFALPGKTKGDSFQIQFGFLSMEATEVDSECIWNVGL